VSGAAAASKAQHADLQLKRSATKQPAFSQTGTRRTEVADTEEVAVCVAEELTEGVSLELEELLPVFEAVDELEAVCAGRQERAMVSMKSTRRSTNM
jgi:hypothetical protein